jgi:hypothetical protein
VNKQSKKKLVSFPNTQINFKKILKQNQNISFGVITVCNIFFCFFITTVHSNRAAKNTYKITCGLQFHLEKKIAIRKLTGLLKII